MSRQATKVKKCANRSKQARRSRKHRPARRATATSRKAGDGADLQKAGLPPFVDVLFPKTGANHEPLIDDILIVHPDYEKIFEALEDLDELDPSVLNEHCIIFTGESRLGKTRLLAEYIATRMPRRTKAGLEMRVLYLQIPEKPTIRSVAVALLREFGEAASPKDTADDLLNTLVTLGAECGLLVICLDDLHHFVDQRGEQGQFELTEWLKRLVMRMRVALVVCGLQRTEDAVRLNEQLYARMDTRMRIRRFDWGKDADREAFQDIVAGVRESVETEFTLPKEAKDPFRWYVACSGKIGFLIKIGRRMIKLARKARSKSITMDMLDKAWERSRYESGDVEDEMRPFHASFACKPDAEMIKRILDTGIELGPKEAKARSKKSKKAAVSKAIKV